MKDEVLIRTEHLNNGLSIEFFDRSNRYFGDYHRLRIEARCRVPLSLEAFAGAPDPAAAQQDAAAVLGREVVFCRTLEKMGVAGEEVERSRQALVESFLCSALPYLGAPEFPARFVAGELARRRQGRRPPWPR